MIQHFKLSILLAALSGMIACGAPALSAEQECELGNALLDHADWEGAIRRFTAALDQDPKLAKAFNNRGLAFAALREYHTAILDYDACLGLPQPFAEAYFNRGVARFRLGNKADAILDFTEAIKLNEKYGRAFAGRGLVFSAGGDRNSALADLRKALELAPNDWSERKTIEAEIERLSEAKK